MMLHFTQTESTFSYFEATRMYIECHGKPGAFYSDKYSVFRNVTPGKTGNRVTHFGRAMYELNIDTFCANSSPAKGRVERAHLTLQDRLVKELRLRGINTVPMPTLTRPPSSPLTTHVLRSRRRAISMRTGRCGPMRVLTWC